MSLANDIKQLACIFTGVNVNYKVTTKWYDGSNMTDAKVDGIIYRKIVQEGITTYYVDTDFLDGKIYSKRFGVVGDGIVDDTVALQRFFDFISKYSFPEATLTGKIKITGKVIFDGINGSSVKNLKANCTIISDYTSTEEMIRFKNWYSCKLSGHIKITGKGSPTYNNRLNFDGVVFENCGRLSIENISCNNFKNWGLKIIGTSSLMNIDFYESAYCGSSVTSGMNLTRIITQVEQFGSSTSAGSRSKLTFDTTLPTYVQPFDQLIINNKPYQIKEINEDNTVSVYPQIDITNEVTTAPIYIVKGGGVYIKGTDVSCISINKIDSKVNGFGIYNAALYPASIKSVTYQFNAICHAIGEVASSAYIGGVNEYAYYEASTVHILLNTTGTYSTNYTFLSNQGLDLSKCFRANALRKGNSSFIPNSVNIIHEGQLLQPQTRLSHTSNPFNIIDNYKPVNISYIESNTSVLTLKADAESQRLLNGYTKFIVLSGINTNAPTGNVTITKNTGYTINGVDSSIMLPLLKNSTLIIARLVNNNWIVEWIPFVSQNIEHANLSTSEAIYTVPSDNKTIYVTFKGATSVFTLPTIDNSSGIKYIFINKGTGNIVLNTNSNTNDIDENGLFTNTINIPPNMIVYLYNNSEKFTILNS